MKNIFIFCLCLLFYNTLVHAQDTIPFTLNKTSNICIKAQINESDTLTLMFHTASTGITLIQKTVDTKLSLNLDKSHKVQSWGGTADAKYSEGNSMIINNLKWDSMTIYINENSGVDTDGKFGYDLFSDKIVNIDYNKNRIIVHSKMPKIGKGYSKMKIAFKKGTMYIAGDLSIGKTVYKDSFMFHSGYGGAILLDPKIAEKYNMKTALKTISTSELRDSYDNVIKIETKLLPKLKVGGKTLKNIPLSFAAQSSQIPMKVFGNDLLKRFNVIFDFQHNDMYLKINDLRDIAYVIKK